LNGKQAKAAANTTHEPVRKKACNRLAIDVLPLQRTFIDSCGRLIAQAALRDRRSIESTNLSPPVVYDIGLCKYKKVRIVLTNRTVRPNNPSFLSTLFRAPEPEQCVAKVIAVK